MSTTVITIYRWNEREAVLTLHVFQNIVNTSWVGMKLSGTDSTTGYCTKI